MAFRLFRRGKPDQTGQSEATPAHLLVPFSNSAEDQAALQFACEFASAFQAKLTILCLVEVPRSVSLHACPEAKLEEGEQIAQMAREIAQQAGCRRFETVVKPAYHCGHTIVETVQLLKADMVLMAVRYRRRLGLQTLDDTVETVLRRAPCYVWLYGAPEQEK
ncbi:MAG: universal stress protein [Fimbriimonadales bacterium]|nr:universal stress protein [Fimbriimonadales bacterium]